MKWLALLPLLAQLISLAEKFFTGSKQGPMKKDFVTNTVKTIVDGVGVISTGGQKKTFNAIEPFVDSTIDSLVNIAFHDDDTGIGDEMDELIRQ